MNEPSFSHTNGNRGAFEKGFSQRDKEHTQLSNFHKMADN